jgi:hypothetical protein
MGCQAPLYRLLVTARKGKDDALQWSPWNGEEELPIKHDLQDTGGFAAH